MASWLSAWRSEPNVNKSCTEAEEGSRTINKIKPIISAAALAVSVFQAAVKKQHSRTRKPFIQSENIRNGSQRLLTIQVFMCLEKTLHVAREIRLKMCEYLKNYPILTNTLGSDCSLAWFGKWRSDIPAPRRGACQYSCTQLNKS